MALSRAFSSCNIDNACSLVVPFYGAFPSCCSAAGRQRHAAAGESWEEEEDTEREKELGKKRLASPIGSHPWRHVPYCLPECEATTACSDNQLSASNSRIHAAGVPPMQASSSDVISFPTRSA